MPLYYEKTALFIGINQLFRLQLPAADLPKPLEGFRSYGYVPTAKLPEFARIITASITGFSAGLEARVRHRAGMIEFIMVDSSEPAIENFIRPG